MPILNILPMLWLLRSVVSDEEISFTQSGACNFTEDRSHHISVSVFIGENAHYKKSLKSRPKIENLSKYFPYRALYDRLYPLLAKVINC
jgi:hypothetical protein